MLFLSFNFYRVDLLLRWIIPQICTIYILRHFTVSLLRERLTCGFPLREDALTAFYSYNT